MRPCPLFRSLIVALLAGSALAGCARRVAVAPGAEPAAAQGGAYVAAPAAYSADWSKSYTLDSGDRLRVSVFGQDGISNTYLVDVAGHMNVALIGPVQARGLTTLQLAQAIADRLRNGYVREPHVSVEVETYRPFYILGEVNAPGQYPYVANMTVETAVAIAGGFTPRGEQSAARLTRNVHGQSFAGKVPINTPVQPGDTINVAERWF
ncbi:MAG: polysaccharide export protein [Pseudorhodoplanes sp.]|nr:polysaccharide export protein [Pseudorhodoplanes sp.]